MRCNQVCKKSEEKPYMKAWIRKALDAAAVGEPERKAARAAKREKRLAYLREYRKRQLAEEAGKWASLPVHSPLRKKLERSDGVAA